MFGFTKKSTGNLLIAAIIFSILFIGSIYARLIKIGFILLMVSSLLWTVFAEELRLEKCYAECPPKRR